MVTSQEIKTFQSATPSELDQARSLISRNKAFAARGDPRLQRIISVFGSLSQVARDKAFVESRERQVQTLASREDLAQQSFAAPVQTLASREDLAQQSFAAPVQTLASREDLAQQSFAAPVQTRIPTPSFTPIPTAPVRTLVQQQVEPIRDFGDVREQTRIDTVRERAGVREVLFGEVGKPFVGFDVLPKITPAFIPREKDVSLQQVQTLFRQAPGRVGFPVRVAAELIPTTPGEVGITGGLIGASLFFPPIVGTGISLGVAGLGARTVFDPGLTVEQRTAGGLVGTLGATGVIAGVTPFLRGFGAKGVRTAPEGFEVLPGLKGVGDIGLIQPGRGTQVSVDLPPTSPLVRGGFQVRPGEKAQFLGRDQFLTTSQRGLFEAGRDIPIEREFFVTPQEPTLGIAETRVSRLGLQDPFKFPESVEIGLGLPPRSQIGVTRGEVARTEVGGAFAIGRGTELEAIRTTGIITDVTQIGRARIKGQGVDIFEFEIGRIPGRRARPSRPAEEFISTEFTTRVAGEPLLGTLGIRTTRGVSAVTSALVSPLLTTSISPDISIPISPGISPPTIGIISPPISPGISPPISPGISTPLIPEVSPPIPPTISPPFFPPFEPPPRPPRRRGRKRKEKKVKRGKRIITPIRPSFTGIVLGIEEAAFVDPRFGVSPIAIRGLATGFDVPTRRRKAKTKKKVTKKKVKKKKK